MACGLIVLVVAIVFAIILLVRRATQKAVDRGAAELNLVDEARVMALRTNAILKFVQYWTVSPPYIFDAQPEIPAINTPEAAAKLADDDVQTFESALNWYHREGGQRLADYSSVTLRVITAARDIMRTVKAVGVSSASLASVERQAALVEGAALEAANLSVDAARIAQEILDTIGSQSMSGVLYANDGQRYIGSIQTYNSRKRDVERAAEATESWRNTAMIAGEITRRETSAERIAEFVQYIQKLRKEH